MIRAWNFPWSRAARACVQLELQAAAIDHMPTRTAKDDLEQNSVPVRRPRFLIVCAIFVCIALSLFAAWLAWYLSPRGPSVWAPPSAPPSVDATSSRTGNLTRLYVGMGCFWELQWATTRLEMNTWGRCTTAGNGPNFVHPWRAGESCGADSVTSKCGYAGGNGGLGAGGRVCYRCGLGCVDDYDHLGHAEVVEIALETATLETQFRQLADDFFHEFTGPFGQRARPDQQMDRGPEYRSLVGWPGGVNSPLWPIFQAANVHGMTLREGSGDDADLLNVVWVMDSEAYPFYAGEEFHRA